MRKLRVAVSTKDKKGLDDEVSEVFGRANTFTILDVIDGEVKEVRVLENPAASYQYGAGPIVVKTLIDHGVDVVIASEFGPGASTLLDRHKIVRITVNAGSSIPEALKKALLQIRDEAYQR